MSLQGKAATDSTNLVTHYASAFGNSFRTPHTVTRTIDHARSIGSRSHAIDVGINTTSKLLPTVLHQSWSIDPIRIRA
jgi:hypothetical protein